MKIELVEIKLDEKNDDYSEDRIIVAISPNVAKEIAKRYEMLALHEHMSYVVQGIFREVREGFRKVFDVWCKKRDVEVKEW